MKSAMRWVGSRNGRGEHLCTLALAALLLAPGCEEKCATLETQVEVAYRLEGIASDDITEFSVSVQLAGSTKTHRVSPKGAGLSGSSGRFTLVFGKALVQPGDASISLSALNGQEVLGEGQVSASLTADGCNFSSLVVAGKGGHDAATDGGRRDGSLVDTVRPDQASDMPRGDMPAGDMPRGDGLAMGCNADTAACCGNDSIDEGEECDGLKLGSATCSNRGFDGGKLACTDVCSFDTAACYKCGDNVINGNEQCEGNKLGSETCTSQGFDGGTLACTGDCIFDTVGCHKCGDAVINGDEKCDGSLLGNHTCASLGFDTGTLSACLPKLCTPDSTSCSHSKIVGSWATVFVGTFTMGSPVSEPCRDETNETAHQVTLTHDFEIQTTPVTQANYQAMVGNNPSHYGPNGSGVDCGANCPVENITWAKAAEYCNALSTARGLAPCYSCNGSGSSFKCVDVPAFAKEKIYSCPGYRLPTDAEWEYAYRAGTDTAFYSGATDCNAASLVDAMAWSSNNANGMTHEVAQLEPNAYGLYDMAGNVHEWVHDFYTADLGSSPVTDPWGPSTSSQRGVRGGAYNWGPASARAAARGGEEPGNTGGNYGFRCVRTRP